LNSKQETAMQDDFTPLLEDSVEVREKFAGEWPAIAEGEVIGIGETANAAAAQAEATHPGREYVLDVAGPLVDLPSVFDE
jgi:hypothetical protein